MYLSVIDSLSSTQSYLKARTRQYNVAEWTICRALSQWQGKGMGSNTWISHEKDNLQFSMLLRPTFLNPEKAFAMSKLTALAIRQTISRYTSEIVTVKWPNDIYIGDKKVCGMLVENSFTDLQINTTIIGIGINVNQQNFPQDIPNPVSLLSYTTTPISIERLLWECLFEIKARYRIMAREGASCLEPEYCQHLYRFNSWHNYKTGDTTFLGKICGTDTFGFLQIEDKKGNLHEFDIKEVTYL